MGNLLDLVITDSDERFIELKTLPPLGVAVRTHVVLTWKYATVDMSEQIYHEKLDVRKINFSKLNKEFSNCDWDEIFYGKNVNDCYES